MTSLIIFLPLILCKNPDKYIDKLKKYIINFIGISFSVLFSIALIEIYLHLAKPNFLKMNQSVLGNTTDFFIRGYFDEKVFNKKNSTFRIMGLADSFGEMLADKKKNYHNFLENKFDMAYGRGKIEIINTGIPRIGPGYYLHILEKYGDLLKPDLVLVGFFVGNDFMESNFDYNFIGLYILEPRDVNKRILGYFGFKNLWLCQFLNNKWIEIRENKIRDRELNDATVEEKGEFSKSTFLEIERRSMWIAEKSKQRDLENFYFKSSKVISNIKKWCDKRNIELIISIFPDRFQIEQDLRQEIFKKYGLKEDSLDLYYPNKLLLNFCKQANIHCVDLLEKFKENAKFEKLYLVRDTHWNEEGNKLVADIIFNFIKKNKLARAN